MWNYKQLIRLMESVIDLVYEGDQQLGPRPSKSESRARKKLKRLRQLEKSDPDKRFGATLDDLQQHVISDILKLDK